MATIAKSLDSLKFIFFIDVAVFVAVLGCGTLPQGQVTAVGFNVSGFTLAAEMAYSDSLTVQSLISSISKSQDSARTFMRNLLMNAVSEVLQEQGRNALLLDSVIQLILQQLNVTIEYMPLNCPTATNDAANPGMAAMADGCFIINGMVVSLCINPANCMVSTGMSLKPVPAEHRIITGSLRTSNVIMATWSRQMWQSVLSRVHRTLLSGGFGKYFNTAIVTVNN